MTRGTRTLRLVLILSAVCVLGGGTVSFAQEPPAPQPVSREQLKNAIDKLGDLDYPTRTAAARTVRRTPAAQAVPALVQAVAEHTDGYVRNRALVLLTGFNDPRTGDAMREALRSPNDRLRATAYSFFEHQPDSAMAALLVEALDKEVGEFVRPALVRALAAHGSDPRVQAVLVREVGRGQNYFRSAVIEALGDYKAHYAYDAIVGVAKLDGPLQVDAAIALGKIGEKRAVEVLSGLQQSAPKTSQPYIAAAICLLGINCGSHENYLVETLRFSDKHIGFQELLRGAASGLGALAVAGHTEAFDALVQIGIPSRDPTRAPVALALGTVALRNTTLTLAALEKDPEPAPTLALIGEGFDMLEEDLDKERFFALVRRTFWQSAADSPTRRLTQTLIGKLDF
jgi:HEAT repeat protein